MGRTLLVDKCVTYYEMLNNNLPSFGFTMRNRNVTRYFSLVLRVDENNKGIVLPSVYFQCQGSRSVSETTLTVSELSCRRGPAIGTSSRGESQEKRLSSCVLLQCKVNQQKKCVCVCGYKGNGVFLIDKRPLTIDSRF